MAAVLLPQELLGLDVLHGLVFVVLLLGVGDSHDDGVHRLHSGGRPGEAMQLPFRDVGIPYEPERYRKRGDRPCKAFAPLYVTPRAYSGSVVVSFLFLLEDLPAGSVDLILIFVTVRSELHLIYGPTVLPILFHLHLFRLAGFDPGVFQGDGQSFIPSDGLGRRGIGGL